jgi:hypothetical protein
MMVVQAHVGFRCCYWSELGLQYYIIYFFLQNFSFLLFVVIHVCFTFAISTCTVLGMSELLKYRHIYLFVVHHCLTNPCMNGMPCVVTSENERACNCSLGFIGSYCERKCFYLFFTCEWPEY